MTDTSPQYNPQFRDEVKGVVVGEGNTIYNYYYTHDVQPTPLDATVDKDLPCPYRGLFHFGPEDADVFFGRDIFVETLYAATKTRTFIPVIGASGSGKSSVVLAGLIPRLQQEGHWQFTHFRPGTDPFHSLALALVPLYAAHLNETERIAQGRQLARYLHNGDVLMEDVFRQIQQNIPGDRLLIIADQFEELYTLCANNETRKQFLDNLIRASKSSRSTSQKVVLILTMRADFLGKALSHRPFADVLQGTDVKLAPMNRTELQDVIEKPAKVLGVTFEAGLVERILEELNNQPGNLPLLEFALTELWNQRTEQTLTHTIYEAIGQVEGALARHADEKYGLLSKDEREKVRRIFIQLVRPGEGAEDTRRIAMKAELGEQSWSIVQRLADARLVVTSRNATNEETVEVVHEALIRNWSELRQWMEGDRVFRAWQERLRAAQKQWESTNQDTGSLLRGAALAEAEEQLIKRPSDLVAETKFIQKSIEERTHLQKQQASLRNRIIGGLSVGLITAMGLLALAAYQWRQAKINESELIAYSTELLFEQGEVLEGAVKSLQAGIEIRNLKATPSRQIINQLQRIGVTIGEPKEETATLSGHTNSVNAIDFSSDNRRLVSASSDKTIKLWDLLAGKEILTISEFNRDTWDIKISPDDKSLAITDGNDIVIWDIDGNQKVKTISGHIANINGIDFSPTGDTLASASADKTVKIWDVSSGQEIYSLVGHKSFVNGVSFSPDGELLASASADRTIKIWDVSTGREIHTITGHKSFVNNISFSPNSMLLASASADKTVKIWNMSTGKELLTLSNHTSFVNNVSFHPNGQTLVSAGADNTVIIWDVKTGQEVLRLIGKPNSWQDDIIFSPNGKVLATAEKDNTIKIWDVENVDQSKYKSFEHEDEVQSIQFILDGKNIVSGSINGVVKFGNVEVEREIYRNELSSNIFYEEDLSSINLSYDSSKMAISTMDGDFSIRISESSKKNEILNLFGHTGPVLHTNFSQSNKLLVSSSDDQTGKVWDLEKGEEKFTISGHVGSVNYATFSPDEKFVAASSDDKSISIWDTSSGQKISTLSGHKKFVYGLMFSSDAKLLASASRDNTIKIWDTATNEVIHTLSGHKDEVFRVSFGPSNKILASASSDRTVKIWDVETGEELQTLYGHLDRVRSLSFSPDGRVLASGSSDGTVILWNLSQWNTSFRDLLKIGCRQIGGYLINPDSDLKPEERRLCDGIDS